MLLSYNLLGEGLITTALPVKKQYTSINFTGECYLDNIHAQNIVLTSAQTQSSTPVQIWGVNTILLANFENNLEAGNITNSNLPITHWRIYRKLVTDSLYTLVTTLPFSAFNSTYTDYLIRNAIQYDYLIMTVSNGVQGIGTGGSGMADIGYGWLLQNTSGSTQFQFSVELNTDNINSVGDVSVIDNYTRYPVVSKGQRRYQKGKITCMLWKISSTGYNGTDSFPQADLSALEAFINGSEVKYLKNAVGQMWKVETMNFSYKYRDEFLVQNKEQPFLVNFEWCEVGSVV